MSTRTRTYNAFEANLSAPITAGAQVIPLDSAANLTAPGYLVVDPENVSKREYIRFGTINVNNLENCTRGLAGSAAGAQAHTSAVVRGVMTHQVIDEIFDDIETNEADIATNVADIAAHAGNAGDPHAPAGYLTAVDAGALYLPLGGGTMTGPITLDNDPSSALHAATKQYVDAASGGPPTTAMIARDGSQAPTANIPWSNFKITGLAAGTAVDDAVRKDQLDTEISTHEGAGDPHSQYLGNTENAISASKWQTGRTITVALTGDVTGSDAEVVDGTVNKTLSVAATVVNDSHTHDSRYFTEGESDTRFLRKDNAAAQIMAGAVLFPAGSLSSTSVRFGGQGGNDGIYGTENETSFAMDGHRVFTVWDDAHATQSGESAVEIRSQDGTPTNIIKLAAGAGGNDIMIRGSNVGGTWNHEFDGSVAAVSTEAIKKLINSIPGVEALERLRAVDPAQWIWDTDDTRRGLIGHGYTYETMAPVYPDMVRPNDKRVEQVPQILLDIHAALVTIDQRLHTLEAV